MNVYRERAGCRACGGDLSTVIDLGMIFQSDFLEDQAKAIRAPLTLARCGKCGLVQLRHDLNLDTMYRKYWYRSGINKSMVAALRDVVDEASAMAELKDGDVVVDIGANDGTMISMYPEKAFKVGFDPAVNLKDEAGAKCDIFVNDYFTADKWPLPSAKRAKIVTTIAMFYDLPNPHRFIDDVCRILDRDGVWVIQFTDLLSMLCSNAFDNICHEHVEYYSLKVLVALLEQHRLDVFKVSYNDVNGGSLRACVCWKGQRDVDPSVMKHLLDEFAYMSQYDDPFTAFAVRVDKIRGFVVSHVRGLAEDGKVVAVAGASTKGNTLLQYFGLDSGVIRFAAEVSPAKYGLRTVGTGIEIIPEAEAIARRPDCFLVLPWHFTGEFLRSYSGYLEKGGSLLVPMPVPVLYIGLRMDLTEPTRSPDI